MLYLSVSRQDAFLFCAVAKGKIKGITHSLCFPTALYTAKLDLGSSVSNVLFCDDGEKCGLHMKAKASIDACTDSEPCTIGYKVYLGLLEYH